MRSGLSTSKETGGDGLLGLSREGLLIKLWEVAPPYGTQSSGNLLARYTTMPIAIE
jgi:hypothetical protein